MGKTSNSTNKKKKKGNNPYKDGQNSNSTTKILIL